MCDFWIGPNKLTYVSEYQISIGSVRVSLKPDRTHLCRKPRSTLISTWFHTNLELECHKIWSRKNKIEIVRFRKIALRAILARKRFPPHPHPRFNVLSMRLGGQCPFINLMCSVDQFNHTVTVFSNGHFDLFCIFIRFSRLILFHLIFSKSSWKNAGLH